MTVKMLLRARAAPSPARSTAMPRNPYSSRPATAARPKEIAVSSGTAITPSAMFWPEDGTSRSGDHDPRIQAPEDKRRGRAALIDPEPRGHGAAQAVPGQRQRPAADPRGLSGRGGGDQGALGGPDPQPPE